MTLRRCEQPADLVRGVVRDREEGEAPLRRRTPPAQEWRDGVRKCLASPVDVETRGRAGASVLPHLSRPIGVSNEVEHAVRGGAGVTWRVEDSTAPVDNLGRAAGRGHDSRPAGRQRLDDGQPERLVRAAVQEQRRARELWPRIFDRADEVDRAGDVVVGGAPPQLQREAPVVAGKWRPDKPHAHIGTLLPDQRADLDRKIGPLPVDKRAENEDLGGRCRLAVRGEGVDRHAGMHDLRLDPGVECTQLLRDSRGGSNDGRGATGGSRDEPAHDRSRHEIVMVEHDRRAEPRSEQRTEGGAHPTDDQHVRIEVASEPADLATVTGEPRCGAGPLAEAATQVQGPLAKRERPDAGLGSRCGERPRRAREADLAVKCACEVDQDSLRPAENRRVAHEQDNSHHRGRLAACVLRPSDVPRLQPLTIPLAPLPRSARVALVHDFLLDVRGGERVFIELCKMWPEADIFTAVYDERGTEGWFADRNVHPSFLQRLRPSAKTFRALLPLYPIAIESFDLSQYDLVVSSSSAWAHAVLCDVDTLHVSYCHNPFRYAWNERDQTLAQRRNPFVRAALRGAFRRWRQWDWIAAQRTDRYIANSRTTQARIRAYFGREASVVYPPVDTGRFRPGSVGDHYAVVTELMPHKQIDVAVAAFNQLGLPLVVVGDGPWGRRLRTMAAPNITFLGRQTDEAVVQILQGARALVQTSVEEFGIAAVECQAAGRPVIARRSGGALETIVDGVTGCLWSGGPEALAHAVRAFDDGAIDPAACVHNARRFDVATFRRRILEEIDEASASRRPPAGDRQPLAPSRIVRAVRDGAR